MYHHDFGVRSTHWLMRWVTTRRRIALCTDCCDWGLSPLAELVEKSLFRIGDRGHP